LLEWDTGETTYEPLNLIAIDYPVTCAEYAEQNKLIESVALKGISCMDRSDK
jgi:hypothetical protein